MPHAAIARPFLDASPAQIREVLLAEERGRFDAEYADACRVAAEDYDLDPLQRVMECWRRIAWMTSEDPEGHRLMLARAEYATVTRTMAPADAPAGRLREMLAEAGR